MSDTLPAAASFEPAQSPRSQGNGYGITALILGIVTMVGFAIPFVNYLAIVTGAAGVVFGIIGLVIKFRPRKAAIAGLIVSGLGLLLSIILAWFTRLRSQEQRRRYRQTPCPRLVSRRHPFLLMPTAVPHR